MMLFKRFETRSLVVACLLLSSFLAVGSIHLSYALPFHTEEFDHILLAENIAAANERLSIGHNWELGFGVWLASLMLLSGLPLSTAALIVPTVLAFTLSLSVFVLVRHIFREDFLAFICAFFSFFATGNPTVMGLWFLVPVGFALSMMPALFYFFLRGLESLKYALFFILIFFQTTLVHPAFTIILLPAFTLYLLANPSLLLRNQLKILVGIAVLVLLLPFFAFQLGFFEGGFSFSIESFRKISHTVGERLTWETIYPFETSLLFADFTGQMLLALAFFGFGFVVAVWALPRLSRLFSNRLFSERVFFERRSIMLAFFLVVTLALYAAYNAEGKALLGPHERVFMASLEMLLIFAGIGLFVFFLIARQFLSALDLDSRALKTASLLLFALIAAFMAVQLYFVPFTFEGRLYQSLETGAIPVVGFIECCTKENASVLALPWNSSVIRNLTQREIFATPVTRAGKGDVGGVLSFFTATSCEQKTERLERFYPDYVFGKPEIDCSFESKVYSNGSYHLFNVSRLKA